MKLVIASLLLASCVPPSSGAGVTPTGGGPTTGGVTESVSPAEAAIIVAQAERFMKDCGDCVAPGFDFTARTVAVSASDLAERDKWVHDIVDPNGSSAHDEYARAIEQCHWRAPEIVVDIAVVKFWQVNRLAPPLVNIFEALRDTCGNPPNPQVQAFVGKIQRVHVKVDPDWPSECTSGQCGYAYSFDGATATLEVGVHNHPSNLVPLAAAWLKKQG